MLYFNIYRNILSNTEPSNLYDIDDSVKVQPTASKSLPNTPQNGEIQVKQKRTRACSAVVNAKRRVQNDFHELDAYLERKQMEKHGYGDNTKTSNEEFNLEYLMCIENSKNSINTQLYENYSNSLAFCVQDEEKPKLLSDQYQESFKPSTSFEINFAKDTNLSWNSHLSSGHYLTWNFIIFMTQL